VTSDSSSSGVTCTKVDGIARVVFNHPPINLMTLEMFVATARLISDLAEDDDVRVVILSSANPDFFIAHFDVEAILAFPTVQEPATELNLFHRMCESLRTMPKATIAVMKGDWKPITPKQASATAKLAMDSKSWAQVGMDPTRHAYFYDRATLQPVVSADEAIQVGPLVLAKNPVYGNKEDFRFSRKQADDTDEPVRIRLGRTDNTAANKALDSLQAKLAANPLNETELMRKGAAVKLSVFNGKLSKGQHR